MNRQEELLCRSIAHAMEDPTLFPAEIRVRVEPVRVRIRTLSTLSGADLCGGGDLVAGVLARFTGRFPQVALFAMEAEEAYALLRDQMPGVAPLESYTALGHSLLGVTACAIDPLGVTQEGSATLQEDSVISTLLRTHAPSDTAVVCVDVVLRGDPADALRPAYLYVLAEPKPFTAVLAAA
jgi:hypothetical protein